MNTIMITGATRGLGLEIAQQCYGSNHDLVLCGRDRTILEKLARDYMCSTVCGDMISMTTQYEMFSVAEKQEVDTLVCCAGVYQTNLNPEEIDLVINTNLTANIQIISRFIPLLTSRKGTIIVVNSTAGKVGNASEAVYCASKFGLRGYVESIAGPCMSNGLRILSVYPGAMQTQMAKDRVDYDKLLDTADVAKVIVDMIDRHTNLRLSSVDIARTTY